MKAKLANIGLWFLLGPYLIFYCIMLGILPLIMVIGSFGGMFNREIRGIYEKHPMWYNPKIKKLIDKCSF